MSVVLALIVMAGVQPVTAPPPMPVVAPPPVLASGPASVPLPLGNPATWIQTGDYPVEALRNAWEGRTMFRLAVDEQGNVGECRIVLGSGHAVLDQATCDLVSRRARFSPARDDRGRPVAGYYANSVRWVLPKVELPPQPGIVVRSYDIDVDGTMKNCRVESASGSMGGANRVGPVTCAPGVLFEPPLDTAGKPVRKHVTQTVEIRVEGEEAPVKSDDPPLDLEPSSA